MKKPWVVAAALVAGFACHGSHINTILRVPAPPDQAFGTAESALRDLGYTVIVRDQATIEYESWPRLIAEKRLSDGDLSVRPTLVFIRRGLVTNIDIQLNWAGEGTLSRNKANGLLDEIARTIEKRLAEREIPARTAGRF